MSDERGDSRITLVLSGVTDDEVDSFLESIADICVERGVGESDEDDVVRSLIYASPYEWPEDAAVFLGSIKDDGAARITIPSSVSQEAA